METHPDDSKIVVKHIFREAIKNLNYDLNVVEDIVAKLKLEDEEIKKLKERETIISSDLEPFFQPLIVDSELPKFQLPNVVDNLNIMNWDQLDLGFSSETNFTEPHLYKDKFLENNLLLCFKNLQQVQNLRGVVYYIQQLFDIFKSFRCNFSIASAFKRKLYEFILALGTPATGLIFLMDPLLTNQDSNSSFFSLTCLALPSVSVSSFLPQTAGYVNKKRLWTEEEIRHLEEVLDSSHRYLRKFSQEHCLEILVENNTDDVLQELHSALSAFLISGYKKNRVPDPHTRMGLQPLLPFRSRQSLLDLVDHTEQQWQTLREQQNLDLEEFTILQQEVEWARNYYQTLVSESNVHITPSYVMPLANPTLKQFWISKFEDSSFVSFETFLKAVSEEMEFRHYDPFHIKVFLYRLEAALSDSIAEPTIKRFPSLSRIPLQSSSHPVSLKGKEEPSPEESPSPSPSIKYISSNDLARELRWIPMSPEDQNPILHLQHFVATHRKELRRYAPANPKVKLYWNDGEEGEEKTFALSLLSESTGIINCCDPRFSGRTTTLLSLCYDLPEDRDLVYLDLHHSSSEIEAMSQICLQLGIRRCQSLQEFNIGLRKQLLKLRARSVIVFDNLESKFKEGDLFLSDFIANILSSFSSFMQRYCFVFVGFPIAEEFPQYSDLTQTLSFPQLTKENQFSLAKELLPADPQALVRASQGSAAMMLTIAKCCNLKCIREAALRFETFLPEDDPSVLTVDVDRILSLGFLNELTPLEKAIVACLVPGLTPFDVPMAWALSMSAFNEDSINWWVAWKGLLSSGWFMYRSLSYETNPIAHKYFNLNHPALMGNLDDFYQDIWNKYYQFWSQELARMHFSYIHAVNQGVEPATAQQVFDYFTMNLHHFKALFSCFNLVIDERLLELPPPPSAPVGSAKAPKKKKIGRMNLTDLPAKSEKQKFKLKDMTSQVNITHRPFTENPVKMTHSFIGGLAGSLAGIISPALTANYTPTLSLVILFSIRAEISGRIGLLRINSDISDQLLRLGKTKEALALLTQISRRLINPQIEQSFPIETVRVHCLRSQTFERLNHLEPAIEYLKKSAEILMPLSASNQEHQAELEAAGSSHIEEDSYAEEKDEYEAISAQSSNEAPADTYEHDLQVAFFSNHVRRELKRLLELKKAKGYKSFFRSSSAHDLSSHSSQSSNRMSSTRLPSNRSNPESEKQEKKCVVM